VYAQGEQSLAVEVELRDFERLLRGHSGEHALVDLEIQGADSAVRPVLVREVQHDPVSQGILHIDFHAVALDRKVETSVRLVAVGASEGVKKGGVLDLAMHDLPIECLPTDIPENIEADVSALDIGDSLHVRDLTLPEGITATVDPGRTVASVFAPRVEEEVAEAELAEEGLEAEEPEVIGEKKEEEEAETKGKQG
jgi:large subunit ribosomal protein L25